jgi:hypothetical protein
LPLSTSLSETSDVGFEPTTSALNPALALILQKNKGLENEKAGDMIISENVSGDVERSGLEPLTSTMPLWRSTN